MINPKERLFGKALTNDGQNTEWKIMEYEKEEWRDVPGFVGKYQVSDVGRIRSLDREVRTAKGVQHWPGKVLSPFVDSTGYLYANLGNGGGGGGSAKKCLLHRLVLTAFKGAAPDGMEACHHDGNRQNASLSNLRWDTRPNNAADRRRHGTHRARAKLTLEQVAEIRASTCASREVGKQYGVASSTIRAIRIGQNWK